MREYSHKAFHQDTSELYQSNLANSNRLESCYRHRSSRLRSQVQDQIRIYPAPNQSKHRKCQRSKLTMRAIENVNSSPPIFTTLSPGKILEPHHKTCQRPGLPDRLFCSPPYLQMRTAGSNKSTTPLHERTIVTRCVTWHRNYFEHNR